MPHHDDSFSYKPLRNTNYDTNEGPTNYESRISLRANDTREGSSLPGWRIKLKKNWFLFFHQREVVLHVGAIPVRSTRCRPAAHKIARIRTTGTKRVG